MHSFRIEVLIQHDPTANAAVVKFVRDFPKPPDIVDLPIVMDGNVVAILTTSTSGRLVQLELLMADRQLIGLLAPTES